MRRKTYWYRTDIPRDSGIYWVDFCFYWFRIMLKERIVKGVVFEKRLYLPPWVHDKDLCRGYWDEFTRKVHLNAANKNYNMHGTRVSHVRTLLHEMYHALDPGAQESYVHDVAEPELWELSSDAQRAYLRKYVRNQWIQQHN